MMKTVGPAAAIRLELLQGATLRVTDLEGEQVADLVAFAAGDVEEWLSSGRTLDSNGSLFLTEGHALYSNRGNVFLRIVKDTAGRHDFLHAPCSAEMFAQQYGNAHPGCLEHLADCLARDGVHKDRLPITFNLFMHVDVDPVGGALTIRVPSSRAGDHVELVAAADLVVAVSACAAERTNNGRLKPIGVEVLSATSG